MKVLILGGTFFFGKKIIQGLLDKNYEVTVITRGHNPVDFENVEHIKCDVGNQNDLQRLTEFRTWDVAINQICFDELGATIFSDVFSDKVKKVIVTSSVLVYENEESIEHDFDEKKHLISNVENKDYSSKKRDVEKIISSKFSGKYILPRLPIVIGKDDYTKRLLKYIHIIRAQQEIGKRFFNTPFNLITSDLASKLIVELVEVDYSGPINIALPSVITVQWIVEYISKKLNIKPIWLKNQNSPLIFDNMVSMDLTLQHIKLEIEQNDIKFYVAKLLDFYLDNDLTIDNE